MITFKQFKASKQEVNDLSKYQDHDDNKDCPGYVYLGCLYIEVVKSRLSLMLGNAMYETEHLEELERILYCWASDEGYLDD